MLAATLLVLGAFQGGQKPEDQLTGIVVSYLRQGQPIEWGGLDQLPNVTWAAQTISLENCLPDGGCYTRQGRAVLGGRTLAVIATGARTMVSHLYFRNAGAPLGEPAVLSALKQAGFGAELARCPVPGKAGSTNWYRLTGEQLAPAYLSVQAAKPGRNLEGFVLSPGTELPALQPNQVALYSEQCGEGMARAPVSTLKPHELLGRAITALLPSPNVTSVEWKSLATAGSGGITWDTAGPKKANLTAWNDPNPMMLSGQVAFAGRRFSAMASGNEAHARNIYLEEQGLHPRGEHMLMVVYQQGIAVKLVRCGPVYTESTNNWYSLSSTRTTPVMIRQSIRYDGNQVQESYALRLDGSLPPRDPRDRDPGVNGCQ